MVTCYCPQKLDLTGRERFPGVPDSAHLIAGDVDHGVIGCVPVPGVKPRKHEPLTNGERKALAEHGFPWNPDYWPTIRIEARVVNGNRGPDKTPSCRTVKIARDLRSACVKLGIGYHDGKCTRGRLVPGAVSAPAIEAVPL